MSHSSVQPSSITQQRPAHSILYATALSLAGKGFIEEALKLLKASTKLAFLHKDYDGLMNCIFQMAHIFAELGNFRAAEKILNWSKQYLPKCSRTVQGKFYVTLCGLYLHQRRAEEVVKELSWVVKEFKEDMDPAVYGTALTHLGAAYAELEDYVLGRRVLEEALPYIKPYPFAYALVLANLAFVNIKLNETEAAEVYLREAEKLAIREDLREAMTYIRQNYAELFYKRGQHDKAHAAIEEAIRLFTAQKRQSSMTYSLVLKARILAAKGELDKAFQTLQEAKQNAQKYGLGTDLEFVKKAESEFLQTHGLEDSEEDPLEVTLEEIIMSDPFEAFFAHLDDFLGQHPDMLASFQEVLKGIIADPRYLQLINDLQSVAPDFYYAILTHDLSSQIRFLQESADQRALLLYREIQTLIRSQMQYTIAFILQKMKAEHPFLVPLLDTLNFTEEEIHTLVLKHLLDRVNFPFHI